MEVWGEEAQARLTDDTVFLTRTADGWRVTAAACRSQGADLPYDVPAGGLVKGVRAIFVLYLAVLIAGHRLLHRPRLAGAVSGVRRFLRENSLSLGFGLLFLLTLVGQAFAGVADFNDQRVSDGLDPISLGRFVTSSAFAVDVMENWQSEYLQFFLYIFGTVWLIQRGSAESKKLAEAGPESDEKQRVGAHAKRDSPSWVRAGGWRTTVFSRSLGLLMGALFLLTWAVVVGRRLGRLQRRAARRPRGPGELGRLPRARRVLEPDAAELAVGDAGRRLDGHLHRLPPAARLAGVQAGGCAARGDRPDGLSDSPTSRHIDMSPGRRCETAPVSTIDLNADVGEGFGVWRLGDDDALLGIVTSANVACGFHAGDPSTMRRVCERAAAVGVAVGAQVAYRDLPGFGRRFIDVEPAELADDVLYQLAALDGIARASGSRMAYVKPHGALYNAVVDHEAQARAVVRAVRSFDEPAARCSGCPGPRCCARRRTAGLRTVSEGFADRGYTPAGTLVPRREPGALVHDPAAVADRAVRMAVDGEVVAVDGTVRAGRGRVDLRARRHPGRRRAGRGGAGGAGGSGPHARHPSRADRSARPASRSDARSVPASRSPATSSTVRPSP